MFAPLCAVTAKRMTDSSANRLGATAKHGWQPPPGSLAQPQSKGQPVQRSYTEPRSKGQPIQPLQQPQMQPEPSWQLHWPMVPYFAPLRQQQLLHSPRGSMSPPEPAHAPQHKRAKPPPQQPAHAPQHEPPQQPAQNQYYRRPLPRLKVRFTQPEPAHGQVPTAKAAAVVFQHPSWEAYDNDDYANDAKAV